jgi:hypothetical protein
VVVRRQQQLGLISVFATSPPARHRVTLHRPLSRPVHQALLALYIVFVFDQISGGAATYISEGSKS